MYHETLIMRMSYGIHLLSDSSIFWMIAEPPLVRDAIDGFQLLPGRVYASNWKGCSYDVNGEISIVIVCTLSFIIHDDMLLIMTVVRSIWYYITVTNNIHPWPFHLLDIVSPSHRLATRWRLSGSMSWSSECCFWLSRASSGWTSTHWLIAKQLCCWLRWIIVVIAPSTRHLLIEETIL